ncbi:hypothetical protein BC628DRAFT_271582 [Trametes gibbosa]|nr:hypothetical protein BC628DRAFT_271582 [Trametes gibbosa]
MDMRKRSAQRSILNAGRHTTSPRRLWSKSPGSLTEAIRALVDKNPPAPEVNGQRVPRRPISTGQRCSHGASLLNDRAPPPQLARCIDRCRRHRMFGRECRALSEWVAVFPLRPVSSRPMLHRNGHRGCRWCHRFRWRLRHGQRSTHHHRAFGIS